MTKRTEEVDFAHERDEATFWERVAISMGQQPPVEPDWAAEIDVQAAMVPCVECGSPGACAYDSEGRALIHVTPEDDDG